MRDYSRDTIIGFNKERFLKIFMGEKPSEPPGPAEEGPARLDAVLIEVDVGSGRAVSIERIYRER